MKAAWTADMLFYSACVMFANNISTHIAVFEDYFPQIKIIQTINIIRIGQTILFEF